MINPHEQTIQKMAMKSRTGLSLIHEREKEKRQHILINTESFGFMQYFFVLMGIVC
jgi:hypothetical protein